MSTIDRRSLLTDFLPGAAVAAAGLVSVDIISSASAAVASPLASTIFVKPNDMTEKIEVAAQDPRGPYHRRWGPRRQPTPISRFQCWYHRGRKRCGYR
jgi:hypothetical protein